ncbi:MAG: MarC family protein [archaeon]
MFSNFLQVFTLFFVIIDPFLSFAVFFLTTQGMEKSKKIKIAIFAILLAAAISYTFLIFGEAVLKLLNTDINNFKVAGGIILGILGIHMTFGTTLSKLENSKDKSSYAVASIIATPLLCGPAAIMTIIVSSSDYGKAVVGLAVGVVLLLTGILLIISTFLTKLKIKTAIQVMSTMLGLVTLAWGVNFVRAGLGI